VTGKEVVQVYVNDLECSLDRPLRELKAFTKVELAPGESTTVSLELHARDLSFYSPARKRWVLESGDFEIAVGASSRDLRLRTTVTVNAPAAAQSLTQDSSVGEWLAHPVGGPALREALDGGQGAAVIRDPEILRMVESLPLRRLVSMSGGRLDLGDIDQLIAQDD
jgi:beta-glucosidase